MGSGKGQAKRVNNTVLKKKGNKRRILSREDTPIHPSIGDDLGFWLSSSSSKWKEYLTKNDWDKTSYNKYYLGKELKELTIKQEEFILNNLLVDYIESETYNVKDNRESVLVKECTTEQKEKLLETISDKHIKIKKGVMMYDPNTFGARHIRERIGNKYSLVDDDGVEHGYLYLPAAKKILYKSPMGRTTYMGADHSPIDIIRNILYDYRPAWTNADHRDDIISKQH